MMYGLCMEEQVWSEQWIFLFIIDGDNNYLVELIVY